MKVKGFIGPMCSGKTNELLKAIGKNNKRDIIIKPKFDTRTECIRSRAKDEDGNVMEHKYTHCVDKLEDLLMDEKFLMMLEKSECIFIDEVHFFEDLYDFIDIMRYTKNIMFAGLDFNFKRIKFSNVNRVCNMDNVEIVTLKSKCDFCHSNNAEYSFKKYNLDKELEVGYSELYGVSCNECFENMELKIFNEKCFKINFNN